DSVLCGLQAEGRDHALGTRPDERAARAAGRGSRAGVAGALEGDARAAAELREGAAAAGVPGARADRGVDVVLGDGLAAEVDADAEGVDRAGYAGLVGRRRAAGIVVGGAHDRRRQRLQLVGGGELGAADEVRSARGDLAFDRELSAEPGAPVHAESRL